MTIVTEYYGRNGDWVPFDGSEPISPRGGGPVASFTISPDPATAGEPVTFDGSGSTNAIAWAWDDAVDINDPVDQGSFPLASGTEQDVITYTWNTADRTHVPRLTVYNASGITDSHMQELYIAEPWSGDTAPDTAPTPSGVVLSDTAIRWSWTGVGDATGYSIRLDSGTWTALGNVREYDDTGLAAEQTRTFEVLAYNTVGDGPASSLISRTTQAADGGDSVPTSWQDAFDQTVASGGTDETPLTDWYAANVGYAVNGWSRASMTVVGTLTCDTPGLYEGYDAFNILIDADDVEIANCHIRGNSVGDGIRYKDRFGRLYGGTHIHHCVLDQEGDPGTSTHSMRLIPKTGTTNIVEYCDIANYSSGHSPRGDVEMRYCRVRDLDTRYGHRTAININGARCHIHHNVALQSSQTGSATFPVYGSYGDCTDSLSEYNIALYDNVDYVIQVTNWDGAQGTTNLVLRNNYTTIRHNKYPSGNVYAITDSGWNNEDVTLGPNYWLDGTLA